jgi:hypothetical protein
MSSYAVDIKVRLSMCPSNNSCCSEKIWVIIRTRSILMRERFIIRETNITLMTKILGATLLPVSVSSV